MLRERRRADFRAAERVQAQDRLDTMGGRNVIAGVGEERAASSAAANAAPVHKDGTVLSYKPRHVCRREHGKCRPERVPTEAHAHGVPPTTPCLSP